MARLSRAPNAASGRDAADDEWGRKHGSGINITGRLTLNHWRLVQDGVKLNG